MAVARPAHSFARTLLQALLRPYAQVLLSRSLLAGVFVAAAIAMRPALFLLTLLALALAALVTALLGLGLETVRNGGAGCMAVLTTLALPAFAPPGGSPIPLVVLGTVFAVLFFAAFQAVCSSFSLPAHALPFVAATWIVHLAARMMPAGERFADFFQPWPILPAWTQASSWLDLPAILVFGQGRLTGLFILLAIAVHSRIALLLAALGALTALGVQHGFRPGVPTSAVDTIAGFNAMLAAMAVGGCGSCPNRPPSSFPVPLA